VSGDAHAQFCEGLGVQLPRATHPPKGFTDLPNAKTVEDIEALLPAVIDPSIVNPQHAQRGRSVPSRARPLHQQVVPRSLTVPRRFVRRDLMS
jgi:hypothetical protein